MLDHGFTNDKIEAVKDEARASTTRAIKHYIRGALVGYALLVAGLGIAIRGNANAIHASAVHSQQVRNVICLILTQADYETYALAKKGVIDAAQLQKSLEASGNYRKEVGPAPNCKAARTPPPIVVP